MASGITVEVDTNVLRPNTSVGITAFDTPPATPTYSVASGLYDLEIRRYRYDQTRNPLTDAVVATTSLISDADGYMQDSVGPSSLGNYIGDKFLYYPKVVSTEAPSIYGVPAISQSFRVYDNQWVLIDQVKRSLGQLQTIPVYALKSKDNGIEPRRDFSFTYSNWNPRFDVDVYRETENTNSAVDPTSYTIDYPSGIITFAANVPYYEEIEASFVFSLFSDDDIRGFLRQAIGEINYIPPMTNFTLDNYPAQWEPFIVQGATLKCLNMLFIETIFRERQIIFSDAQFVSQIQSYYATLGKAFDTAIGKKSKWGYSTARVITGYDTIAPPRITASNYQAYAYLRGRAL